MSPATRIRTLASLRSRARGAVLFIALIVLVAMTLAGIAIMRSVDTATLIAGNLAFKQGTVQSADNGIEQGYQWLLANRPALSLDNAAQGYNSGYSTPVWTNAASWVNSVTVGTDAAGNTISYQIHRMCNCPNTLYNGVCPSLQANQCALDNPLGTGAPPPPAAGRTPAARGPEATTGLRPLPGPIPHRPRRRGMRARGRAGATATDSRS